VLFKAIVAAKTRNARILRPSARAAGCAQRAVEILQGAGERAGLPRDALQVIPDPTLEVESALKLARGPLLPALARRRSWRRSAGRCEPQSSSAAAIFADSACITLGSRSVVTSPRFAALGPGLAATSPGSGPIMIRPGSGCHQGVDDRAALVADHLVYQSQAFGLIGSPTEPSRRSEDRSWASACSAPHFMHARITVGAV
jgi:hypothetical protein